MESMRSRTSSFRQGRLRQKLYDLPRSPAELPLLIRAGCHDILASNNEGDEK